jgi:hypothetical protein
VHDGRAARLGHRGNRNQPLEVSVRTQQAEGQRVGFYRPLEYLSERALMSTSEQAVAYESGYNQVPYGK